VGFVCVFFICLYFLSIMYSMYDLYTNNNNNNSVVDILIQMLICHSLTVVKYVFLCLCIYYVLYAYLLDCLVVVV